MNLSKSNDNKRESSDSKDYKTTVFTEIYRYILICIFFLLLEFFIILWINGCILRWREPTYFTLNHAVQLWSKKT